ncbi:uncharacterized protein FA14DRAFT_162190 [Meira miltonrushii]|uniref:UvrD-like helicase C-terminal domain-containing protein n=1 Tax=Meira miltonrushii TaxID=1280837 RepID=A0A316V643_9BASI|nr:uncharacterized protein FA14DRAFT_162190 [Meira miltonrushii]PWN33030.1 hypothetical protein FA14DRAFT_162190 [Meira miltonrushii]
MRQGLENIDICSNEALDILSFLGAIQNPNLHHLVERSLVVFSKCRDVMEPDYENLPGPDSIDHYINALEDDPRRFPMSDHHRQYLSLLRRLSAWINMRGGLIHEAVKSLLEELQYKERVLRTRLAPDGSPSPPPNFDVNHNAPHPSSDYAGARWQNVRSLLIRLEDFDDRITNDIHPLDLFLRECHAYAPEQLAYLPREPEREVTISTMHYGIGSEYDVVFISGSEKGSLPCPGCRTDADIQQDKALFHLSMLCARKRLYFGFLQDHGLTSFLDNVYLLLHFRRQVQE